MRCIVVAIVATGSTLAYAQASAPTEYPIEVVDRPDLMYAGMSEIAIGYSRSQGLVTTADSMGNLVRMRSKFGEESASNIGYTHSFGRLELVAVLSTDDDTSIGVRFAATPCFVLAFHLSGSVGSYPEGGNRYTLGQSLRAGYRVVRIPHRVALYVFGGVFVGEYDGRIFDGSFDRGVETSADIGTYADVQLVRNLSAFAGGSAGALVHSTFSGVESRGAFGASGGLQFSLRRWDFLAAAGVRDVTDTRRLFVTAQIAFRWGL